MYVRDVTVAGEAANDDKARRREARELVATYHQQELRTLLERVREGFTRLDAGAIDEFELDDLIHRYKQAAGDLWEVLRNDGFAGAQRGERDRLPAGAR